MHRTWSDPAYFSSVFGSLTEMSYIDIREESERARTRTVYKMKKFCNLMSKQIHLSCFQEIISR